jgi:addiction module HigA family antidote
MTKLQNHPSHPGKVLSSFLAGRTDLEVARSFKIPVEELTAIYAGERDVTPELSARLEKRLKTRPGFWLRLQANWDDWHATTTLK